MIVKVIKKTDGWNVGDSIEVSDERAVELANEGVIDKPLEVERKDGDKHVSKSKSTTKGSNR